MGRRRWRRHRPRRAARRLLPGQSTAAVRSGRADLSFWTHDPGYEKFFTEALPVADRKSDFDFALDITTIAAADIPTKLIAQAVAEHGDAGRRRARDRGVLPGCSAGTSLPSC